MKLYRIYPKDITSMQQKDKIYNILESIDDSLIKWNVIKANKNIDDVNKL